MKTTRGKGVEAFSEEEVHWILSTVKMRKTLRLTLEDIAQAAGTSRRTIGRIREIYSDD